MGIKVVRPAELRLADEDATLQLGAHVLSLTRNGLIFLKGELGVGKTTLVRGLLRELGYEGKVKSPTYTIVESYALNSITIQHFDLYRLSDPRELLYIGTDELLAEAELAIVEWPERGKGYLPEPDLKITLAFEGTGRIARIAMHDD